MSTEIMRSESRSQVPRLLWEAPDLLGGFTRRFGFLVHSTPSAASLRTGWRLRLRLRNVLASGAAGGAGRYFKRLSGPASPPLKDRTAIADVCSQERISVCLNGYKSIWVPTASAMQARGSGLAEAASAVCRAECLSGCSGGHQRRNKGEQSCFNIRLFYRNPSFIPFAGVVSVGVRDELRSRWRRREEEEEEEEEEGEEEEEEEEEVEEEEEEVEEEEEGGVKDQAEKKVQVRGRVVLRVDGRLQPQIVHKEQRP
ncbi:unnamed protein product [Pleuronectes platessa]|uniref:Uncharacterized protein n=1 Tax=Pleuronectes platessa TaxID=8262 RepID=A0A9N7UY97_PLEPL|nr:unnamed protein product [Pleuronectes platessa]